MNKQTTLGILGGGQLGRMSAIAAANLGIKTIILTPEDNAPASQVASETIIADYRNKEALKAFAAKTDFITYEFENIPVETIAYLKTLKPVYPDERVLEISQDRTAEKSYLNSINIPTARWSAPNSPQDAIKTLEEWNTDSCIFKTIRFGYDGKGQARHTRDTNIETLWTQFKDVPVIMEEIINFKCEISLIIARDKSRNTALYGPMLNEHKDHILSRTIIPAPIAQETEAKAIQMIKTLAEEIDLIGVLTLELFVTKDGALLANEIAPRTHNSGHWSIDACAHSQFENHVRAVCGLPVIDPMRHSDAEMINLIGPDIEKAQNALGQSNTCIHLYGKSEIRKGRKMGHMTTLFLQDRK